MIIVTIAFQQRQGVIGPQRPFHRVDCHQLFTRRSGIPEQHALLLGHKSIQQAGAIFLQPVQNGALTLTIKTDSAFHLAHIFQHSRLGDHCFGQAAVDLGAGVEFGQGSQDPRSIRRAGWFQ